MGRLTGKTAATWRPWWREQRVEVYLRNGVLHLIQNGWTGHPIAAHSAESCGLIGRALLARVETLVVQMLEKKARKVSEDGGSVMMVDDKFASAYPLLHSYLTQNRWPDGSPRETSSIILFVDGPTCKAMLRDKDEGLCLWVASTSLWLVFDVLEAKLADPAAEWRQDRQEAGQKASRVKKHG